MNVIHRVKLSIEGIVATLAQFGRPTARFGCVALTHGGALPRFRARRWMRVKVFSDADGLTGPFPKIHGV